ncbi:hypothetical protein ONZ45_g17388 [Pleurotus djamor]|nr:hypothetical protein ONZ45_g17388 [Pleurotus djamor]
MVIDDTNTGIPIATIIFSPKKDAKAAHASYDGAILEEVLCHWREGMGKNEKGESFEICIGNTDNDTRERQALQNNWPNIHLTLCMFHIWQCWRNGLTRCLAGIPAISRQETRERLGHFLMRQLKDITTYPDALSEYNEIEKEYQDMVTPGCTDLAKKISNGALKFLAYFKGYIALESFWFSWSKAGVIKASEILGIPADQVARTTNHLESFNARIKGCYFDAYEHSGRLPRFDVWILLLVTRVLPDFFTAYDERKRLKQYRQHMRQAPTTPPCPRILPDLDSAPPCTLDDQVEASLIGKLQDDFCSELVQSPNIADILGSDNNSDFEINKSWYEIGSGDTTTSSCNATGSMSIDLGLTGLDNGNENNISDISMLDIALQSSLIIQDLPDGLSLIPSPSPSSEDIPNDVFLPSELFRAPSVSESHPAINNNEVIAYQEMLVAEDELVRRLRHLRAVSTSPNIDAIITTHLSPSTTNRVLQDSENGSGTSSPAPCTPLEGSPALLEELEVQRKERRKESHGLR